MSIQQGNYFQAGPSGTIAINSNQPALPVQGTVTTVPSGTQNVLVTNTTGSPVPVNIVSDTPTLPVSVQNTPVVTVTSGTVTVASITAALPAGSNALGSIIVSNFPGTQPVSGTVTANLGSAIPTGANAIGSVTVTSIPTFLPTAKSFVNITTATTTVVKASAGVLYAFVMGTAPTATAGTAIIYNNTAASGTILCTFTWSTAETPIAIELNANMTTGITIVTTGSGISCTALYI